MLLKGPVKSINLRSSEFCISISKILTNSIVVLVLALLPYWQMKVVGANIEERNGWSLSLAIWRVDIGGFNRLPLSCLFLHIYYSNTYRETLFCIVVGNPFSTIEALSIARSLATLAACAIDIRAEKCGWPHPLCVLCSASPAWT